MYRDQLSGRDLDNHLDDCLAVVDDPEQGEMVCKMLARFARTFERDDCELSDLT